jgi:hypothetical protein
LAPSIGRPRMGLTRDDGGRTWTHHLDRGSVEGAHAVEFSKTVAPLQGRCLLPAGAPGSRYPAPERTDEYSAESARWSDPAKHPPRPTQQPTGSSGHPPKPGSPGLRRSLKPRMAGASATCRGRSQRPVGAVPAHCVPARERGVGAYETICTVTLRLRARSSKSISTICCQVPSASSPSTSGIVSEAPITAARRWAWAFVSWLSRLCW